PGAAALLADRTMPRIGQQAPIDEAIGLMLEGNHERLLVLDDERLVGVLTRPGLLRALAQSLG
ncbi:MAG TPA: CBS domain-containing protein, partial [Kouleothrix sp.]|nr:CBS domain-containing protein [Kouleothrix sp.]